MGRDRGASSEDLEATRDRRVYRTALGRWQSYGSMLRHAARLRFDLEGSVPAELTTLINESRIEEVRFAGLAEGRVYGRRRPGNRNGPPVTVYVDECGSHSLFADEYPMFALAAVIVRDSDIPEFDILWKEWKRETLGSEEHYVHETELRNRQGIYGTLSEDQLATMESCILKLPFTGVVCALNRLEFVKQFGTAAPDISLSSHPYLMMLDFLLERVAMVLDEEFAGGCARVIAESRGLREDAVLQYEHGRLQLDGTSYVSGGMFRQLLRPGMHFQTKEENVSGLQIADLMARPCAEKCLDPAATPTRWKTFASKLSQSVGKTKNSPLGLKLMPWSEMHSDFWKS